MIGVGIFLLSLAVGDTVASGLSGVPTRWRRAAAGAMTALVFAGVLVLLTGPLNLEMVLLAIACALVTLAWVAPRLTSAGHTAPRQVGVGLLLLGIGVAGVLALSGLWPDSAGGPLARWFGGLPQALTAGGDAARLVLAAGIVVFLGAPANGVVRAVLTVSSTRWQESEQDLTGGRLIGVLERWLIFAFVAAGDPTAAALVVSAKSILRFPEISRTSASHAGASPGADAISEYFLLGSLASWTTALLPLLLL